ncbi:mariner Mos1 transposase [Trichonephila clavipes]|nr:mariner Mos1 transposase [Trichonephila clavipes]
MSAYEPNSRHLREVLIFCFNMKKSAAEAHRMLSNTYGDAAIIERTCREWFQRFKNGDFDVKDQHGIWWDQLGVVYYELLKPTETITGDRYRRTQLLNHKSDEAWLYYYDPTIKQQSSEWKHPSSPTSKKAKTVKSAVEWRRPPTHHWYAGNRPGLALALKCDRCSQTTLSRLASGHIKYLSFSSDKKISICPRCQDHQTSPEHIMRLHRSHK